VLKGFGHFQVLTAEEFNTRFAHKVDDPTLLDPMDADAFEQGEWLKPTAADGTKFERAGAGGNGPKVAYPIAGLKGATDAQSRKKAELYVVWEQAYTTSFDPNGTYSVGTPLRVELKDIGGGVMRSVLTDAAASGEVVAEVEVPPVAPLTDFNQMRIRRARYQLNP
jgi:hypothetical protein